MQADRYKREVSASVMANTGFIPYFLVIFSTKASFVQSTRAERFFIKPGKPCHVGIHWSALAEYSQADRYKREVSAPCSACEKVTIDLGLLQGLT